jgi:DNA-binding response OmpR family regulator
VAGEQSAGGHRILVVDDNVDSAEVLAMLLGAMGHEAFVAHTGEQALRVAKEELPTVIFLDLALPDMSGFDVARRLRADVTFARTRLIGLSGFSSGEYRTKTREAGIDDYVEKPVEASTLASLLGTPAERS